MVAFSSRRQDKRLPSLVLLLNMHLPGHYDIRIYVYMWDCVFPSMHVDMLT